MLEEFLDWLFEFRRRALAAKLWRVIAADHVNGRWAMPEPVPVFEGWRYLAAARARLTGYAA